MAAGTRTLASEKRPITTTPISAGNGKRQRLMTPAVATLGKWARNAEFRLKTLGWEDLVTKVRGKSNTTETVGTISHKAARALDHLRAHLNASLDPSPSRSGSGSHQSAAAHVDFVCEELLEFCQQGYWLVLPLAVVRAWHNLRLSPLGVIPQRDHRPRLIVDSTFSNVNTETVRMAPPEALQLGRSFNRTLTSIVHANPRFGPPELA